MIKRFLGWLILIFLVLGILPAMFSGGGSGSSTSSTSTRKPQKPTSNTPQTNDKSDMSYAMLNRVIEIRIPAEKALEQIDTKLPNAMGIRASRIRTGPGRNYAADNTGAIMQSEKLYVLEEKNSWLRFRVTEKDQGWSAWIEKSLTTSVAEIEAEREAKFGKRPYQGFDASISCVKTYLKKIARDPDSLKFEEWSDIGYHENDGWIVKCKYRAKNGFGGYEVSVNWFVIRNGVVVKMKEPDAYRRE